MAGAVLLAAGFQTGCATGEFGKANVTPFEITVPSGLIGQSKASIIHILGDPDFTLTQGLKEYWGYRNNNGWYFSFYVSVGKTDAKDMILEFKNNKVKTAYLIDKGSSIGILTSPMAVAN